MDKHALFERVILILERHGVKKIAIFGSYARDEANPESDVDILDEIEQVFSKHSGDRKVSLLFPSGILTINDSPYHERLKYIPLNSLSYILSKPAPITKILKLPHKILSSNSFKHTTTSYI
jgi:hypothetical protein